MRIPYCVVLNKAVKSWCSFPSWERLSLSPVNMLALIFLGFPPIPWATSLSPLSPHPHVSWGTLFHMCYYWFPMSPQPARARSAGGWLQFASGLFEVLWFLLLVSFDDYSQSLLFLRHLLCLALRGSELFSFSFFSLALFHAYPCIPVISGSWVLWSSLPLASQFWAVFSASWSRLSVSSLSA